MAAKQQKWITRKTSRLVYLVALILFGYAQLPNLLSNTISEEDDEEGIPKTTSAVFNSTDADSAHERPSLESLISEQNHTVTGDVQFLLDFAIVGFGKCGSSSLMHWFLGHPDVAMFPREVYDLSMNRPDVFVKKLYNKLPPDQNLLRAYKSPSDLFSHTAPQLYAEHFPNTRLIVGIRHPILWFESFYNFKTQNMGNQTGVLPDPSFLMGPCTRENPLCTLRGHFALHMYHLGKTGTVDNQTVTPTEVLFKQRASRLNYWPPVMTPNPVFLYETSQLVSGSDDELDTDSETQKHQANQFDRFRQALLQYVGLERDFPETPHRKPGKTWDAATQAHKDAHKISICDAQHAALRAHLMELSRETYSWVMESFLPHPDVHVSNVDDFQTSMRAWLVDPCDAAS